MWQRKPQKRLLRELLINRIEAYAGESLFVDHLCEQAMFEGLEKLEPSIVRKDYFLVFSRGFYAHSGDTAPKLWQPIEEVRASRGSAIDKKYKALSPLSIAIF